MFSFSCDFSLFSLISRAEHGVMVYGSKSVLTKTSSPKCTWLFSLWGRNPEEISTFAPQDYFALELVLEEKNV